MDESDKTKQKHFVNVMTCMFSWINIRQNVDERHAKKNCESV